MRRRTFLAGLGAGAVSASALAAKAQQPAVPVIGFLSGGSPEGYGRMVAAFRSGLGEAGFAEGRNVAIEFYWAEGRFERLPGLAAELVRRQVAVIAATTTPAALAAKAATATIPVVFTTSGDPVRLGLVPGLAGQGGNVTGATQLSVEVSPKRLTLLHELIPGAKAIAVLVNPTNPVSPARANELQDVAGRLGVRLHVLHAAAERDLETAFASLAQLGVEGLVIAAADPFFTSHARQLAALSLRHRVPTVFQYLEFAAAGGLLSYGGSITDSYRLAGAYTGRILKGARPGDLPVQQTVKFELFVNLRTAKALDLTVPATLLGQADEVIE